MSKNIYLLLTFLTVCSVAKSFGQHNNKVLFTIDGQNVLADEFKRECRDYLSVADTVGLYSLMTDYADYRLMVHDSKMKKNDTLTSFRNAKDYYGTQLLLKYISSGSRTRQQVDKILKQSIYQYKVSYIKVDIYSNSGGDTLPAYYKALSIKDKINTGKTFESIGRKYSDADDAKLNGGYLGWVSPIDFNVGVEAEDYIFEHFNESQISRPIRSGNSFYLIKMGGRRNAIASVDVSPIIVKKAFARRVNDSLRNAFNDMYEDLKAGKDFKSLQLNNSDVKFSEKLPLSVAYNKYSTHIADIEGVGKFSKVIETSDYFCILLLNSETPLNVDDEYSKEVENKIIGTEIFKSCYNQFLDSVRIALGYKKLTGFNKIYKLMPDSSIFEAKWEPGFYGYLDEPLFTFNNKDYSIENFVDYIYHSQYNTGYTKIPEYVNRRFREYIDILTLKNAVDLITSNKEYNNELNYYSNQLYYSYLIPQLKFYTDVNDTSKVYDYYKKSHVSLKTSHVLNIRFYDYLTPNNKKKVQKLVPSLVSNSKFEPSASVMKPTKSGTFNFGDYDLADRIINSYDIGKSKADDNVFFFDDEHILAIVDIEKHPEEIPMSEIFDIVRPKYFNYLKEEYLKRLRTKYNLVISPDASNVLQSIF